MKDKGVMAVFLQIRGAVKNLKRKENEGDFEFLDAFDEDEFHHKL